MISPKPTDSERLRLAVRLILHPSPSPLPEHPDVVVQINKVARFIEERDLQRLSAVLEALPKKPHIKPTELPTNPNEANRVLEWARGKCEAIDQCSQALTAALGPDNSKIEEKC